MGVRRSRRCCTSCERDHCHVCRDNLPAEVHESWKERLGIKKTLEHLLVSNALVPIDVDPLVSGDEVIGNLLIALVEKVGLGDAVGQEKERNESEDACW